MGTLIFEELIVGKNKFVAQNVFWFAESFFVWGACSNTNWQWNRMQNVSFRLKVTTFFFTVFSFCEKFFCGWTTIRKISMAYCYLIFNVEFSISRKSKTCRTGTWSRSSPLTRGLQPVSVLRHNSCLNKQRVEQQGDGREQGHLKIKHTWMMKDLWVREQEYPMFWWLNVPD